MQVFHSPDHLGHAPRFELNKGHFVAPFERPERMDLILDALCERGFGAPLAPGAVDMMPVRTLHSADYLEFLALAWDDWVAAGFTGDLIAANFPARRMQTGRPPQHIDGRAGYYALASETAITQGTWAAAQASCASAQAAQRAVAGGERAAFALCRPPGHHAARDMFGGYCFLNNAAVAAQMFRDAGAARVAVLDIDFHHGNGTQDIFFERGDVLTVSIHGRPQECFPYFLGYADETGAGAGEGANLNLPLPVGTGYGLWGEALDTALARIKGFGAESLVVALGVDTWEGDPISAFRLQSADFTDLGCRIAGAGLPTVFCMEGGYAIAEIGVNTANLLEGFAQD